MRKRIDKILIFIASIITGALISISFAENKTNTFFSMKSIEYKDAVEQRNLLYKEISDLKESNSEIIYKLRNYNQGDSKHDKVIDDMKVQLNDYSGIAGTMALEGSGIVIKVKDGYYDINESTSYEIERKTLHAEDAAMVLNGLRGAGAEAIAINGYRVLNDTGVRCEWAFIGFNDNNQTIEGQPFYFYALGKPEELEAALFSDGSFLNRLIIRGLEIEVEKRITYIF
ncbi:MAG: DUF881 domain-containing protein, partial [Peptostreptococcaceae bacterium]